MNMRLRYGRDGLEVQLPSGNVKHVLAQQRLPVYDDPAGAVAEALGNPIGTAPPAELARGRSDACIVVSDLTRPVPNAAILPPLLDTLRAAGIAADDIVILVATGLHRANTPEELREMLGDSAFAGGYHIECHMARDASSHANLGTTERGTPALIDRRYVEADLKILTGLVEPHLMAGYSGGRKSICPGIAGQDTIMAFHAPRMIEPRAARTGNLIDNPAHEEALAVAAMAGGADLIVNVTLDEERAVTGVFAGDMIEAHEAAMRLCERQTKAVIAEPVDIVVTSGGGYPLDLTLYQGTKGVVAGAEVCREGGTIILAAECAEGLGGPDYTRLVTEVDDPHEHIRQALAGADYCVDTWQFQVVEKVMRDREVVCVSSGLSDEGKRRCFIPAAASVEQAVRAALERHGQDATMAVMPDGPYVLACLADDPVGRMTVDEMIRQNREE
jgi:nickel-dependent lactate racemase